MLEDVEEEEVLLLVVVVDDPAGVDAVVLGVDVDPDCCCCISKEGKQASHTCGLLLKGTCQVHLFL